MFCLVTLVSAWLLMAFTKGAGGSVHHVVLLWPVPHLFQAVAFAEASILWQSPRWQQAAGWANEYLYRLARYGADRSWTDVIYPLSEAAGRINAPQIVVADWGILDQLALLHQGKDRTWDRSLLEHGVWLGHTPAFQELPGANENIVRAAAAGYRNALLQVIPDRHGRETFEVFRFVRDN
jgi:hypothetical protein